MSNSDAPPTVFVSYSHDSPDHKRWVLEFAEELRRNGVDPIIDAWDLRPGDDVPKFMERGVRDSNRVLMICTKKYVAKANDGVGGVGYEAMIVTSELVRDLGTAKFIPIIRQKAERPDVPTSVATRKYINLSEDADRAAEMEVLLRAPKRQNRAPGDCGSFAGVSSASWCFWGRFATDIPRAKLLKIKCLKILK
jgi:hypothetical protein